MTCAKCECLVRLKNKLGYNLYYCGYKKYGVLKALCGLYINNEEYRKNNKTCKYYKGVEKMTIDEMKNKISMELGGKDEVIAELKAQIGMMKNCFNCKNNSSKTSVFCRFYARCKNNEYWKLAKKE